MPWIKGGLLPSTLAPEWAEARSKRPRSGLGASAPGYVEAGHEFGPGGRHQSSTTLFARSISYEPADMEERLSPRPLWDRSSSLDSLRPQTSLGTPGAHRCSHRSCARPRGYANQSLCLRAHPRRVRVRAHAHAFECLLP